MMIRFSDIECLQYENSATIFNDIVQQACTLGCNQLDWPKVNVVSKFLNWLSFMVTKTHNWSSPTLFIKPSDIIDYDRYDFPANNYGAFYQNIICNDSIFNDAISEIIYGLQYSTRCNMIRFGVGFGTPDSMADKDWAIQLMYLAEYFSLARTNHSLRCYDDSFIAYTNFDLTSCNDGDAYDILMSAHLALMSAKQLVAELSLDNLSTIIKMVMSYVYSQIGPGGPCCSIPLDSSALDYVDRIIDGHLEADPLSYVNCTRLGDTECNSYTRYCAFIRYCASLLI